jgi:hypothetical protein
MEDEMTFRDEAEMQSGEQEQVSNTPGRFRAWSDIGFTTVWPFWEASTCC